MKSDVTFFICLLSEFDFDPNLASSELSDPNFDIIRFVQIFTLSDLSDPNPKINLFNDHLVWFINKDNTILTAFFDVYSGFSIRIWNFISRVSKIIDVICEISEILYKISVNIETRENCKERLMRNKT